jgi:hypothetical protein
MRQASDTVTQTPSHSADIAEAETTVLAWRIHRLRDEPERIPMVALAFAGVAVGGWLLFANLIAVLLLLVVLTGTIVEFLFPINYRLTNLGAYANCGPSQLFMAWEDVKRATQGKEGVYLSPFSKPTALDSFRGIRLRFTPDNADLVRTTSRRLWKGNMDE